MSNPEEEEDLDSLEFTKVSRDEICPGCEALIPYHSIPKPRISNLALMLMLLVVPLNFLWFYFVVPYWGWSPGENTTRNPLAWLFPFLPAIVLIPVAWKLPWVIKIKCRKCGFAFQQQKSAGV